MSITKERPFTATFPQLEQTELDPLLAVWLSSTSDILPDLVLDEKADFIDEILSEALKWCKTHVLCYETPLPNGRSSSTILYLRMNRAMDVNGDGCEHSLHNWSHNG
jgi:hypothetical protein